MLLDAESETLTIKESSGLNPDASKQEIKLGRGVAGIVAQEGEAVLLGGCVSDDPRYNTVVADRKITSAVCAPLKIGERVLGVLNVNRAPGKPAFADEDLQLLVALANHAATVLEKVKLHERLAEAYDASKRRYETLVNTANAAIFATDSVGTLNFINKQGAQMLGQDPSEIEGKPIFDFKTFKHFRK